MGDRQQYKYISAPSNTVVKRGYGKLTSITGTFPAGSIVRVDDSHSFPQGVLDINAASSNTVGAFATAVTDLNIGLDTGIVVAVSSNARVTIGYE